MNYEHRISAHRHPTPLSVDPVDEQTEPSCRSGPGSDRREPPDPLQDGREERSRHRHLRQLERDVAGMPATFCDSDFICSTDPYLADFDHNGSVDVNDLLVLLSQWTQ